MTLMEGSKRTRKVPSLGVVWCEIVRVMPFARAIIHHRKGNQSRSYCLCHAGVGFRSSEILIDDRSVGVTGLLLTASDF